MENKNYLELISNKLINYFFPAAEETEQEVMIYGLMVIFSTFISLLAVAVVSFLLGVLELAFAAAISGGIVRHFAGGVHANTYYKCAGVSGVVFTVLGLLAQWLASCMTINAIYIFLWAIFILGTIVIYFYAPAEVSEKPISQPNKYKLYSFFTFFGVEAGWFLILIVYHPKKLVISGLLGLIWQIISLTPVIYKLFNRTYIRR